MPFGQLPFALITFFFLVGQVTCCKGKPPPPQPAPLKNYTTNFPVSIRRINADDKNFCSGSLISKRTVLTAAHCLVYNNGSKIEANNYIITGGNKTSSQTFVGYVEHTIVHEKLNVFSLENDIGLIYVSK